MISSSSMSPAAMETSSCRKRWGAGRPFSTTTTTPTRICCSSIPPTGPGSGRPVRRRTRRLPPSTRTTAKAISPTSLQPPAWTSTATEWASPSAITTVTAGWMSSFPRSAKTISSRTTRENSPTQIIGDVCFRFDLYALYNILIASVLNSFICKTFYGIY